MNTDLSNINPTIAGVLGDFVKPAGQVRVAIGDGVVVSHQDGDYTQITIRSGTSFVILTPDHIRNLERFLEQIGWRCY